MMIIWYGVLPMAAMCLGAWLVMVYDFNARLMSAAQHLSAGIVLAVVACEFVPSFLHHAGMAFPVVGFILGMAIMLLVKVVSEENRRCKFSKQVTVVPIGMILAIALDIFIDNTRLEDVKEYRYLGVTIDHRLTFKPQALGLIKTTGYKVVLLGRIRKYMDELQASLVYKQMVVPYFDYANFTIDCTTDSLIGKLQKIQNRGLRVCKYSNMYERSSATELHNYFDIKFLQHRRYTQLLMMMFKQSKTKGLIVPVEGRRTRGDHKVKFKASRPFNRFVNTDKSPWYRGVKAWNRLPAETQNIEKVAQFKFQIRYIKPPAKGQN